jgi:mRNA interferase HigB
MLVRGQEVLAKFIKKHRDARIWLESWVATVEQAQWSSIDDLRKDYASADGVKLRSLIVVTVFNVKGNEHRLLTQVNYRDQIVLVLDLLTHAEYDKDAWKGRY